MLGSIRNGMENKNQRIRATSYRASVLALGVTDVPEGTFVLPWEEAVLAGRLMALCYDCCRSPGCQQDDGNEDEWCRGVVRG